MSESPFRHAGFMVWAFPDREGFGMLPRAVIQNTETGAVGTCRLFRVDLYEVEGDLPPNWWWGILAWL